MVFPGASRDTPGSYSDRRFAIPALRKTEGDPASTSFLPQAKRPSSAALA